MPVLDGPYHFAMESTYHAVPGCPAGRLIPAELRRPGTAGRAAMCTACEARLDARHHAERAAIAQWIPLDEPREAMLRPRFREWYTALRTDQWYSARQVAELVLAQRRAGEWRWQSESRILSNEHFLFRGGAPRFGEMTHSRWGD
jgi:hypothetical protein